MVREGPSYHQPQMLEKSDHIDNPPKASIDDNASNPKINCINANKGPKVLNANACEFTPRNLNPSCESDTEVVGAMPPLQRSDTNPYDSHTSRPSGRHDLEEVFKTATAAYRRDIRRTSLFLASGGHQEEAKPKEPVKEEYPTCLPLPAPCPRMENAWQPGKIGEAIRLSYKAALKWKGNVRP